MKMTDKRLKQFVTNHPDRPSMKRGEAADMASEIIKLRKNLDRVKSLNRKRGRLMAALLDRKLMTVSDVAEVLDVDEASVNWLYQNFDRDDL